MTKQSVSGTRTHTSRLQLWSTDQLWLQSPLIPVENTWHQVGFHAGFMTYCVKWLQRCHCYDHHNNHDGDDDRFTTAARFSTFLFLPCSCSAPCCCVCCLVQILTSWTCFCCFFCLWWYWWWSHILLDDHDGSRRWVWFFVHMFPSSSSKARALEVMIYNIMN